MQFVLEPLYKLVTLTISEPEADVRRHATHPRHATPRRLATSLPSRHATPAPPRHSALQRPPAARTLTLTLTLPSPYP